jgi:hypothetical protein
MGQAYPQSMVTPESEENRRGVSCLTAIGPAGPVQHHRVPWQRRDWVGHEATGLGEVGVLRSPASRWRGEAGRYCGRLGEDVVQRCTSPAVSASVTP